MGFSLRPATEDLSPAVQAEEMAGERRALESSVSALNTRGAQIERWLADNESKTPTGPPPCPSLRTSLGARTGE